MVAPLVAGLAGGLLSGIFGAQRSKNKKKAAREQEARIREGLNFLRNQSDLSQVYAPAGARASTSLEDLLGIGGRDSAAARQAFEDYLGSTGYRTQLEKGMEGVTGSAAARGMLGSGSTLRALQREGQGLAQQGFQNYLGNLTDIANRGYGASGAIAQGMLQGTQAAGQAIGQGYSSAADAMYGGQMSGLNALLTGAGLFGGGAGQGAAGAAGGMGGAPAAAAAPAMRAGVNMGAPAVYATDVAAALGMPSTSGLQGYGAAAPPPSLFRGRQLFSD